MRAPVKLLLDIMRVIPKRLWDKIFRVELKAKSRECSKEKVFYTYYNSHEIFLS